MTTLAANEVLRSILAPLKERTEIRDLDGKLLGHYVPTVDERRPDYTEIRKLFDAAESKRREAREAEGPEYTTEEILEHLHTLETPS